MPKTIKRGRKPILDEFTNLPVSAQRKHQLRKDRQLRELQAELKIKQTK